MSTSAIAGSSSSASNNAPPSPSPSSSSHPADKRPVQNLRFQRRTSERAFYEGRAFNPEQNTQRNSYYGITSGAGSDTGSLRRQSMEYPADPEHPHGPSPWANSPQASRTSFGNAPNIPRDAELEDGQLPPTVQSQEARQEPRQNGDGGPQYSAQGSPEQQQQQYQQQQQGASQDGRRPQSARYHGQPPQHQQQRLHMLQYKLSAKITGLERTGKKDPILRFDAYTNLPKFRTTQFRDVRRTHSEFVKLAEHLISSNPEALVPAVPPPLTAAGAGTDEDENRVKAWMQRWLNVVCGNDVLMRDEEMVFFVESDFGYSPVVRRKQPATGVRRKYIKQFAPPPDDTPELLEARPVVKAFYLGTMEAGQKVDRVVKHRRSLGLAESDLGVRLTALVAQETHPGLANAYRKVGKVVQSTGDFHAAQGTAEATTLSDPLAYHSSDAFIVKESLTNRHILLRELLQAQQSTRSKLNAADRLKASSSVKRDKVDEAISALDEARSHESYLQQKTAKVTGNLVLERRKWFARTAADLRISIREYVIREIEAERRTLATLEQVRPDVRNIDASGGLSRLGREALPVIRRSTLASSQGPKGDAWSGVPRRTDGLNRSISGSFATGTVPDEEGEDDDGKGGRKRAVSGASSLGKVQEDDDEDRVDARNAASRLAQTSF